VQQALDFHRMTGGGGNRDGHKTLGIIGFALVAFFAVCGGPFGLEAQVSSGGSLLTLISYGVLPFIWALPQVAMTAELSSRFPEDGGYVVWIRSTLGTGPALMASVNGLMSTIVELAIYPTLVAEYFAEASFIPRPPHSGNGTLLFECDPSSMFCDAGTFDADAQDDDGAPGVISPVYSFLIKVFVVMLAVSLNVLGLDALSRVSGVMLFLVFTPFLLALFIAWNRVMAGGTALFSMPPQGIAGVDWSLWLPATLWSYTGWDSLGSIAGHVDKPGRTYIIGSLLGVFLVTAVYTVPLVFGIQLHPDLSQWTDGCLVRFVRGAASWLGDWVVFSAIVSNFGLFCASLASSSASVWALGTDSVAEDGVVPVDPTHDDDDDAEEEHPHIKTRKRNMSSNDLEDGPVAGYVSPAMASELMVPAPSAYPSSTVSSKGIELHSTSLSPKAAHNSFESRTSSKKKLAAGPSKLKQPLLQGGATPKPWYGSVVSEGSSDARTGDPLLKPHRSAPAPAPPAVAAAVAVGTQPTVGVHPLDDASASISTLGRRSMPQFLRSQRRKMPRGGSDRVLYAPSEGGAPSLRDGERAIPEGRTGAVPDRLNTWHHDSRPDGPYTALSEDDLDDDDGDDDDDATSATSREAHSLPPPDETDEFRDTILPVGLSATAGAAPELIMALEDELVGAVPRFDIQPRRYQLSEELQSDDSGERSDVDFSAGRGSVGGLDMPTAGSLEGGIHLGDAVDSHPHQDVIVHHPLQTPSVAGSQQLHIRTFARAPSSAAYDGFAQPADDTDRENLLEKDTPLSTPVGESAPSPRHRYRSLGHMRLLPRVCACRWKRFDTPVVAIIAQAVIVLAITLFFDFGQLLEVTGLMACVRLALEFVAYAYLRFREHMLGFEVYYPEKDDPNTRFRVPWGMYGVVGLSIPKFFIVVVVLVFSSPLAWIFSGAVNAVGVLGMLLLMYFTHKSAQHGTATTIDPDLEREQEVEMEA
jgi:amino acid transporter